MVFFIYFFIEFNKLLLLTYYVVAHFRFLETYDREIVLQTLLYAENFIYLNSFEVVQFSLFYIER